MKLRNLFLIILSLPSFLLAQRSVSSDPFLKWTCTANGLSYSSIELDLEHGTLLSNTIDKNTSIKIKVNHPTGFTAVNNEIFFGIGLHIVDTKADTLVYDSPDLYDKQAAGMDPSMISNLNLNFTPQLDCNEFTITVRFFDKKSAGEITVNCPFIVAETGDVSNNTNSFTKWTTTPSLCISGQTVDPVESKLYTLKGPLNKLEFNAKDKLFFQTDLSQFKSSSYHYEYSLLDLNGKKVTSFVASPTAAWDGIVAFNFPKTLTQQPYLLTFSVENKLGRIGFSQLLHFKTKKELSLEEQNQFALLINKLALQQLNNDSPRNASQIITNAIYYAPKNKEVLIAAAKVYSAIEETELAHSMLKKADSLYPNTPTILTALALSNYATNHLEEAIVLYKRCLVLNRTDYMNYYQIALCYKEQSKYTQALAYLDTAIRYNQDPYNTLPLLSRIETNKALGNYVAEIKDYQTLSELSPDYWEYYYKIGYNQIDLLDYPAALISLTKAIELNEYTSDPVYERGYTHMKLGNYAAAILDFNQTIVLEDGNEPVNLYLHRGNCYAALKEIDKACVDFKKALEMETKGAKEAYEKSCGQKK